MVRAMATDLAIAVWTATTTGTPCGPGRSSSVMQCCESRSCGARASVRASSCDRQAPADNIAVKPFKAACMDGQEGRSGREAYC